MFRFCHCLYASSPKVGSKTKATPADDLSHDVSSALLFDHLEVVFQPAHGTRAGEDLERARLDHELHPVVVELEVVRSEGEPDGPRLARSERDPLEAVQLLHRPPRSRPRRGCRAGRPRHRRDRRRSRRRPRRRGARPAAMRRAPRRRFCEPEPRIAEPMPEREQGRGGGVDVSGCVSPARRGPPRVQVVVVEGHLADDAREGHGQFAAGVDVAEQGVGDRVPP